MEAPSQRWGILIGEFVHNLAFSLDHLAWQLVLLNGGTPNEGKPVFPPSPAARSGTTLVTAERQLPKAWATATGH